ncbi:MAG: hypothetical protein ACRCWS_07570, partial [Propionibacteriaceae bacterium]
MSALMDQSAATWRPATEREPRLPAILANRPSGVRNKLVGFQRRHVVRAQRAHANYRDLYHTNQGLPIAPTSAVWGFLRNLVATRPWQALSVLLLNATTAVI